MWSLLMLLILPHFAYAVVGGIKVDSNDPLSKSTVAIDNRDIGDKDPNYCSGTIIDDDHFRRPSVGLHTLQDLLKSVADTGALVIGRNDDT